MSLQSSEAYAISYYYFLVYIFAQCAMFNPLIGNTSVSNLLNCNSKPIYDIFNIMNTYNAVCGNSLSGGQKEFNNLSRKFLICDHVLIEPEEYNLSPDGNIYIEKFSKIYFSTDYCIRDEGVYICDPNFEEFSNHTLENREFPNILYYLPFTGIVTSIASLLLHLLLFCIFSKVRNHKGCNLASLSLSLLLAYICILSEFLVEIAEINAALGACIYYFSLSSFFWMNTLTIDAWLPLRNINLELSKSNVNKHRTSWRKFALYSLYSWGMPAVFIILIILFHSTNMRSPQFHPSFGGYICWLREMQGLLVIFWLPLMLVLLLNFVILFCILKTLFKCDYKTWIDLSEKKNMAYCILTYIAELTWFFGTIMGFFDVVYFWYLSVVFITFQGFFNFVVFITSFDAYNLCYKWY